MVRARSEITIVPINAALICDLLYGALKREEDDIHSIGIREPRIEHFLCSVAFAPELVVGYLLRKEALRRGIPIECERRFNGCIVDCCFIENGECAALCEIKGPWGVWVTDRGPLRKDLQKLLSLTVQPSARRYDAWVLVAEDESIQDWKKWVGDLTGGIGELDECVVSPPIPVNQPTGAVTKWNKKAHKTLWAIVFSLRPVTSSFESAS
jgi:hypothetical protein